MVETLAIVGIILNMIKPPQPYPYQYPYQYPTQPYYQPVEPNVKTQGIYPTEYQTPMGTRSWSQAGSQGYYNGQQTQTPTNSLWRR